MTRRLLPLAVLAILAACGPAPVRISVPPLPGGDRIGIAYNSVEVIEIELPTYADGEDIFVQQAGFALTRAGGTLWADDPSRALTLEVARVLNEVTGARVAPEPWPYVERAEARLDIRVSEFAPDLTLGAFVIRGQYYVAAEEEAGRDLARLFVATAPLPPEAGPAAIAAARSAATVSLARQIAVEGLR